jgi:transposase
MLHHREGEKLDDWLSSVKASQIRELQSFVDGVERDKLAVVAGLTLPQNNGVVEGKVNKLKRIKRMGYGRAGFALLRKPRPPCPVGRRKGFFTRQIITFQ